MTQLAAIGDGPIVFTDQGVEYSFPLSAIYFDGGVVGCSVVNPPTALAPWLNYLVARGRLVPGPSPIPANALVLTATAAGSSGNNIVVTITPRDATHVDVTVTETDVYEGLTLDSTSPNFLPTVLGTVGLAGSGTRPGLVRVQPLVANAIDPDNNVDGVPVAGGAPTWKIAAPASGAPPPPTSFTLEARGSGSAIAEWTMVRVTNVQQPATGRKTFTLTVKWTKKVQNVGSMGDLTGTPGPLAFAVLVAAPSGGFQLPRPGAVSLGGGAEAASAVQANATLLANS